MLDSFEINKILGAILGTLLVTLALNIFTGAIFTPKKPEKPGYDIVVTEQPAAGGGAEKQQEEPLPQLLAKADPQKGANVAKKCQVCHDFTKGGPNKVGPNLYGIVGRERATHEGFSYSGAMKSKGGKWTIEELNTYLQSPRAMVPGTTMAFAGISKASDRADLVAYLNTLSDSPQPLPTAPEGGQQSSAPQGQEKGAPQGQEKGAPQGQEKGPPQGQEKQNQAATPPGQTKDGAPANTPPTNQPVPPNAAPAPETKQ